MSDFAEDTNVPTNDCISRQAVIDDIKAIYEYHDTVTEDRILDHLHRLPSAQQWTPVSERLPSYGEYVLLSIGRYVNVGYLVQVSDDDGQYNWFYSGWYHPLSEVDAWMPLPESWEGKE